MEKISLVVLAAGIGSRYGGIKQLDSVTNDGLTLIDFSLYDALRAGFSKVIFVVRKAILEDFRKVFDSKLKGKVEVEYVCQKTDFVPDEYPQMERKKPWGTGHAILSAREAVNEKFCVINADDFYGRSAYEIMFDHLQKTDCEKNEFALVGFKLGNTLSKNGSVSRGECYVDESNFLEQVFERTEIRLDSGRIIDRSNPDIALNRDTCVSMNFWGFTHKIFDALERDFYEFLKENYLEQKAEFLIPEVVNNLVKKEQVRVKVLLSEANWIGMTYKEDKPHVIKEIEFLQKTGAYPKDF